jgi:hypothetical protein
LQSASDPSHLPAEKAIKQQSEDQSAALNHQVATAVVKGLSYFGAGPVVESLVYILELEHSVDLNSLANNLDALRAALLKMFGSAAYVIESKISDSLAKQLGVDSEEKKLDELVDLAKGRIQEPSGKKSE